MSVHIGICHWSLPIEGPYAIKLRIKRICMRFQKGQMMNTGESIALLLTR